MNMTEEEINSLVNKLDGQVPKEGAVIELKQYGGGPDESKMTANRAGYLRLGIEFLKAAFKQPSGKDPYVIEVDIQYLLSDDSDVGFDWFERREELKQPGVEKSSLAKKILSVCLGFVCLGVVALAVIGAVSVVQWLLKI